MAQFLNKGDHIFIPFHENGMSIGYKGPYIYKSLKTCMKNYGEDADEVVEYAPIVRCKDCKYFVFDSIGSEYTWESKCLYNDVYVGTRDFCSRGEKRSDEN